MMILKNTIFGIIVIMLISSVSAQEYSPDIWHPAEDIQPGTFGGYHSIGNYYFNGNVGVGILTPNQSLEISGNASSQYYFGDGRALSSINHSNWKEGQNHLYRLGKIGINKTTTPTNTFDIADVFTFTNDEIKSIKIDFQDGTSGAEIRYSPNLGLGFGVASSGNQTPVTRLIIDSLGNIGIGTLSPSERLDVLGKMEASYYSGDGRLLTGINHSKWKKGVDNITNESYIYNDIDKIKIGNSSSPQGLLDVENIYIDESGFRIDPFFTSIGYSSNSLVLSTFPFNFASLPGITISKDGNLGIGTDDPIAKLTIDLSDEIDYNKEFGSQSFNHLDLIDPSSGLHFIATISETPYGEYNLLYLDFFGMSVFGSIPPVTNLSMDRVSKLPIGTHELLVGNFTTYAAHAVHIMFDDEACTKAENCPENVLAIRDMSYNSTPTTILYANKTLETYFDPAAHEYRVERSNCGNYAVLDPQIIPPENPISGDMFVYTAQVKTAAGPYALCIYLNNNWTWLAGDEACPT